MIINLLKFKSRPILNTVEIFVGYKSQKTLLITNGKLNKKVLAFVFYKNIKLEIA